jgi:ERCC4-type nuclease
MNHPALSKHLLLFLFLIISVLSLADDSFYMQITSLWEKGEKEKVLAIAQKRIQANSKDLAGLVLQLEYQIEFLQFEDLLKTADKLFEVGNTISTTNFQKTWPTIRADIEVIKMMVSKYPEKDIETDRKKALIKGKPLTYGQLIKAIEDDGLLDAPSK